jgi:hypothetical protein
VIYLGLNSKKAITLDLIYTSEHSTYSAVMNLSLNSNEKERPWPVLLVELLNLDGTDEVTSEFKTGYSLQLEPSGLH